MQKLVVLLVVAVACAPSQAELNTARATTYKAPPATLFGAMKATTGDSYTIAGADEAQLVVQTQATWYTPDGQVDTMVGDNLARLQDNSINFAVIVRLVKTTGDSYAVSVEPIALRLRGLGSKAERVDPSDPDVPGWVRGKVASLEMSLHRALKGYATTGTTVPAVAPR